jgi:DNA-binding CsgD family transcriptional regulator
MDDFAALAYEHAPIGVIFTEDRVIRWANPRFAEMFETTVEAAMGESLSAFYPSMVEFERMGHFGPEKMAGTGRYSDERIMKRRGGRLFWSRVRGQALDRDDPFARCVWTFSDLADVRPTGQLSPREMQVARFLAEGLSSKEIAREIDISHRTVETHKLNLFRKMGAKNATDLVARLAGMP